MKRLKGFIFAMIFPYIFIVGFLLALRFGYLLENAFGDESYKVCIYTMFALMLLCYPITIITSVIAIKNKWDYKQVAKSNMIVKLSQIPFYAVVFVLGGLLVIANPILAIPGVVPLFVFDAFTIILSGIVGIAAVWRCYKENVVSKMQMIVLGICQFVFCIDVISSIILFFKTKKSLNKTP